MLKSIGEVNEEFFKQFRGIKILIKGKEVEVPIRYARKSGKDYVEESKQQLYPCIAIQDHSPKIKDEWYLDMKSYFGGISLDGLSGYLFRRPIWFEFVYDVSIVAKGYYEFTALKDYFLSTFGSDVQMLFNKRLSGDDAVGDVVGYTVRSTDIPRTDGVFEINYEFTCSVWVAPVEPNAVDVIKKIILRAEPM